MRAVWACSVPLVGLPAVTGALAAVVLGRADGSVTSVANELAIALVIVVYLVVGAVVMLARSGHLVGRLMFFGAATWGIGEGLLALAVRGYAQDPGSIPGADWYGAIGTASRGLGWLVLTLAVPLLFPDGRLPWRGRRLPGVVVVSAIALFTAASLLAPVPLDFRLDGMNSPTGLPARYAAVADLLALSALALTMVALVVAVAGVVHRWRSGSELERQQLLWFSAAFALPLAFIPFIATSVVQPWMFALVTLPVPAALAVALLQRRLYDVQLVVSRTLTYAALSATVAALYAVTVGGVGALLRERGAPWVGWVAVGVVAVTFAPLRNTLQQAVNRLTYGQWAQPADVLAATGRRLADASDVPALLRTLTAELGTGLGLAYVEITDARGRRLATHGAGTPACDELALTAYGDRVGALRWSRQRMRPPDRRLLADVAGQLGGVVHSAGLLETIRDARERLVLGREEERRRLRRDLHDGLGPSLASLTLQVDTLRNHLGRSGLDLDGELVRIRAGIASTVVDVRRIVEGLRPPALDELGLAGALQQLADRLAPAGEPVVRVDVPPLPAVPAAVEVAAYRVAQEALTNAVRHARAEHAEIVIALQRGGISIAVTDDGSGETAPRPGGVGLTSMHERATEIGGTLTVDARPGRGTSVRMWLPVADLADHPVAEVTT